MAPTPTAAPARNRRLLSPPTHGCSAQGSAAEQRKLVDLLILPPMKDFDLLDWSSFDRAIEAGYNAARIALEQIRDTELAGKLVWPE